MSLLRQVELALLLLLTILTLISVIAYRAVVYERFVSFESAQESRETELIRSAVSEELDRLEALTRDWSSWDDAYRFMSDGNDDFIESNLGAPTFAAYRLNLILFLDNSNTVFFKDIRKFDSYEAFKIEVLGDVQWRSSNLLNRTSESEAITGIVQTDKGPMIISSQSVLMSGYEGPSRGTLVFGRLWDANEIARIAEHAQTEFTLEILTATEEVAGQSGVKLDRTEDITRFRLPIKSVDEHYNFLVKFERPRIVIRQGQIAFYTFMGILGTGIVITLLVIRRFVEKQVVGPLTDLGDQMNRISDQEHLPAHIDIDIDRNDEIGALVTEFEQMLARLRVSQAQQSEAIQLMTTNLADAQRAERLAHLGTYVWDVKQDRMIACSEEFARIRKKTVEEILSSYTNSYADLQHIHPDDRQRYEDTDVQAVTRGEDYSVEYRLLLDNNEIRHILEVCEVELGEDGEVAITRGSSQDVTDHVLLEEQLRHVQKLEAIGQLTGGIAHDFNNLLTVILGNLELASRLTDTDHPSRKHFLSSKNAASKAAALTERLLAFARKQPLNIETVELQAFLIDMQELLDRTIDESVVIETAQTNRSWFAKTDRLQLENAVLNIAINARDAMPEGGVLSIKLDSKTLGKDSESLPDSPVPGQYVGITLTDTGQGIRPEDIDHVFDPFYTTKRFGEGTGLGLSMVYGFIKQSGGHITVDSAIGVGTTVTLYIPASADTTNQSFDDAVSTQGQGEEILVVEDDPRVRDLVGMLLETLSYKVTKVSDSREALETLNSGAEFDLLFTDIVLPGQMNGVELAKMVSLERPDTRILLTSGYPNEIALDHGFLLLKKPYTQIQLSQTLRKALSHEPVLAS